MWRDLKHAARQAGRSPGFSAVVILTLALGIGACAAIFTFVDTLLVRPLPFPEASRLVVIWEENGRRGLRQMVVSPANYLDWRAHKDAFVEIAAWRDATTVLTEAGEPAELRAQAVTAGLFTVLRARPHRGRPIIPADLTPGAPPVVLISHRLWQQRFGGEESAVGGVIVLNSAKHTIAGVMPPAFFLLDRDVDVWAPLWLDPARNYRRDSGRSLNAIGRLAAGVTLEQARQRMRVITARLEQSYPEFNKDWGVNLIPLREQRLEKVQRSLLVLAGAVGFLLLIACANVANLLLARGAARHQEIAVRGALGASPSRLARQLLTENFALSVAGGVLGILAGHAFLRGLLFLNKDLIRLADFELDSRVLIFCLLLTALTTLLFGSAPALTAARVRDDEALKSGARAGSRHGARLRRFFVALQIALTTILLVCSGLLLGTFLRLEGVAPGLDSSNLLTVRVNLPDSKYSGAQPVAFFARSLESIAALPGVRHVSAVSFLPFAGMTAATWVRIAGQPPANPGDELMVAVRSVMPGYFRALGIPVLQGRDFTDDDNVPEQPIRFMVSRAFAEKYLRGERALEQSISVLMRKENPFGQIIGVAGDVREGSLDKDPVPTVYYNAAHLTYTGMTLLVKVHGSPMSLASGVRGAIQSVDPGQPVSQIRTMQEVLSETVARQRLNAWLTISFASAALLLAAIGVYGLMSFTVHQSVKEIGVRLAFGASPSQVQSWVVAHGLRALVIGLAAGIAGGCAFTRVLTGLLFEVEPLDPATFAGAAALVFFTGLAAVWIPARRAALVQPAVALQNE